MKTIDVKLKRDSYPIYLKPGSLAQLGRLIKDITQQSSIAVITDDNVSSIYKDRVRDIFKKEDLVPLWITVPAGEKSKSQALVDKIYTQLLIAEFKRDSLIVALGGGVVGDLAGFVAATFLRGIPFVQVPTTLLAQVDSSVGGKVGINHPMGKNLIGIWW